MVQLIARKLADGGLDTADAEARWLAEAATVSGDPDELVARRLAGEPLQYLTGIAGFRRLEIQVGPGVFVPRPETEVVTGQALALLPPGGTVVDLCCGSGAIGLAIADERPDARVVATELSREALGWARRNQARLGLDVTLLEGSLFDPLPSSLRGGVDLIVTNPPYVAVAEAPALPPEVRDHEPHLALFAGEFGLSVIRDIVMQAPPWLSPQGWIVLEIGEHQGAEVAALLRAGGFDEVAVHPDLAGRDRVAVGRRG